MIVKNQPRILAIVTTLCLGKVILLAEAFILFSCKTPHYSQSNVQSERTFDDIQTRMIGDLQFLTQPDPRGIIHVNKTVIDSLVGQLDSSSPGMLKLKIEGQVLYLDGKPSGSNGGTYTDFFTALDRAVASLGRGQKLNLQGSGGGDTAIDILIKAQRKGDLDLQRSWLKRETSKKVKVKVQENHQDKKSNSLNLQGSVSTKEKEVTIDLGQEFSNQRKIYIVYAIKSMLEPKIQHDLGPISPSPQESGECRRRRTLSAPSILPFKRGDLDRICAASVRKYKDMGFRRIALFPVVHYAGESYKLFGEEIKDSKKNQPNFLANPQIGKDFRFEILNAPSSQEVERCVSLILDAGIELSYLPHVESIVTMNSHGEVEWRIALGFPADNNDYYELAYGPLVNVLRQKGGKLKNPLMVSLAAEIDSVALAYPDTVIKLADRLRNDLKVESSLLRLEWNPNGDFNHKMSLEKVYSDRGINGCQNLKDLLMSKIDGIAPSAYDSYLHIAPLVENPSDRQLDLKTYQNLYAQNAMKTVPTLVDTRELYLNRLEQYVNSQCSGLGSMAKSSLRDRYGIAEFSLQGIRQNRYEEFLEGAFKTQNGQNNRINFWTTGENEFDPLAPNQDKTEIELNGSLIPKNPPGPKPEAQIRKFLECRS